MKTPKWLVPVLAILLGLAGSVWAFTLAMNGRVAKCETLVEVQGEDINDIITEQRAMRREFTSEQQATRKTIHEMWKDLSNKMHERGQ